MSTIGISGTDPHRKTTREVLVIVASESHEVRNIPEFEEWCGVVDVTLSTLERLVPCET